MSNLNNRKILTYSDLSKIKADENKEDLISLKNNYPGIQCKYEKDDMLPIVGDDIFVRETVAEKLHAANVFLGKEHPGYILKIVYGYRHPIIQNDYFNKRKNILSQENLSLSNKELDELTHSFVAVPDVAGHIVGGAVDVTITTTTRDLDMGTKIADFSDQEKIKTFAKNISLSQKNNRKLLHDIMIAQNFAPFYGEWWHFSYGDKEWAAFYNKKTSLYSPISFKK